MNTTVDASLKTLNGVARANWKTWNGLDVATLVGNTHSIDLEKGSSQFLSITNVAQTGLGFTSDFTIEFDFKPESQPTGGAGSGNGQFLVGKYGTTSNQRGYGITYEDVGAVKKIILYISNNGTASETLTHSYTLNNATYYHVAMTFDASTSTSELLINGVSQGTVVGTFTSIFDNTADFTIGKFAAALTEYADGLVNNLRCWSIIRTTPQILANYQTIIESEANLEFSGLYNNNLNDSSGNGNTLTNNNAAVFSVDTAF